MALIVLARVERKVLFIEVDAGGHGGGLSVSMYLLFRKGWRVSLRENGSVEIRSPEAAGAVVGNGCRCFWASAVMSGAGGAGLAASKIGGV
ncbi:MAG: hypothetical protein IPK53_07340 [bacterium]|nr:hypothetical protein [bacterium]